MEFEPKISEEKYKHGDVKEGLEEGKQIRPKILKLARRIQDLITAKVMPGDPEYNALDCCVTDDQADVALTMKLRKKYTIEELSKNSGKSIEELNHLLHDELGLVWSGVVSYDPKDADTGKAFYWIPIFVPGIMESLLGRKELVEKYPQIAQAFSDYTIKRIAPLAGNLKVGYGVMRVIPIESAIDKDPNTDEFDKISYYIDKYDDICVSPCSCRRSRRLLGEGCGHLEEDMCIQLGDAARYFIKTGKARKITKDEAKEILRKAEANGLMHEIPNTDGPGRTHAICNCCGCSCFSLRTVEYFHTPGMLRSNYVAEINTANCVACGECVSNCPVNALRLGEKLCQIKPIELKASLSSESYNWGPDKWNPEYRYNRENTVKETGTSPCKTACPAHIAVQGYIKLAKEGRYSEALELIKKRNPFPAICGRVCSRACELACTRGKIDSPLAIDEIKKFIAEKDLHADTRFVPEKLKNYHDTKIAIIGSGPAGLSCAYYLAIDGYDVTVFEKEEQLGGMMTLGIPSFRLEKDVVNAEIDILKVMGVKFKTGVEVGKDITIQQLRKEGYKGFYVAIGLQGGRNINIKGEDATNIESGVLFLKDVNLGKKVDLPKNVAVIGGGNVAIDVARTAIREGSKVTIYCLESRDDMPASKDEIEETLNENIAIENGWGPKEFVVKDGKITSIILKKCLSTIDPETHHFSPVYDENTTIEVSCDYVLTSVGQSPIINGLFNGEAIEFNKNGTIKADPTTYQTNVKDIFVGGDIYTGAKFAIDAIAAGHEGAISLHRAVHEGQSLTIGRDRNLYNPIDTDNIKIDDYDHVGRQEVSHLENKNKFNDDRIVFTEEQVKKEASRCLSCGATTIDPNMCVGCGMCVTKCKFDAIHLVKKTNEYGVVYEKVALKNAPHIVSRKFKIIGQSIKDGVKGNKK